MIRRELAKDPKLATESWDRFLPKFRRRHLTSAEKSAKKREASEQKGLARKAAQGSNPAMQDQGTTLLAKKKKVYTPFPPPQLPRKVSNCWPASMLISVPDPRHRSTCNWNRVNTSSRRMRKKQGKPLAEGNRCAHCLGVSHILKHFPAIRKHGKEASRACKSIYCT